tara:strand:+ start:598 stop:1191 length:594 start_codon:yes stop_codon:yes gene_type:complete
MKKAAMFGLDARIALAIFGALSVISGAALYSAIQESKIVAIVTSMQEFAKAYEQYILDTGQGLPASAHNHDVSAQALVQNPGIPGWNGPYLPYEPIGSYSLTVGVNGVDFGYFIRTGIEPSNATTGSNDNIGCDGTRMCYIWVSFGLGDDISIYEKLDQYIDNSDGLNVGKFRYYYKDSPVYRARYLIGPSMRDKQN